jgi:hypothetical protein
LHDRKFEILAWGSLSVLGKEKYFVQSSSIPLVKAFINPDTGICYHPGVVEHGISHRVGKITFILLEPKFYNSARWKKVAEILQLNDRYAP